MNCAPLGYMFVNEGKTGKHNVSPLEIGFTFGPMYCPIVIIDSDTKHLQVSLNTLCGLQYNSLAIDYFLAKDTEP